MKTLLSLFALTLLSASAFADIQDPPMNDQGPTRKLGRGLSNIFFGITEIPHTIAQINEREGNAAAASYGVVKGVGRFFQRFHYGVYELFTFPFPTVKGSYRPPTRATSRGFTAAMRSSHRSSASIRSSVTSAPTTAGNRTRLSRKRLPFCDGSLFFSSPSIHA